VTTRWNGFMRPRTAAAAALLGLAATLAACTPESKSGVKSGAESEANASAAEADAAVQEDCDCRRAVKTPLKAPIQPIERDSGY